LVLPCRFRACALPSVCLDFVNCGPLLQDINSILSSGLLLEPLAGTYIFIVTSTRRSVVLALTYVCRAVYFFAFSFARDTGTAVAAICVCLITGQALPLIRAILANCVPPYMQAKMAMSFGALQAVVTLLASVASLIYSSSLNFHPELPAMIYWVFSVMCFLSFIIILQACIHPGIRCNLPDLNGALPADRMGFASSDPLLRTLKTGPSASVDRFKEGLRVASGADIYISSVVSTLDTLNTIPDEETDSFDDRGAINNISNANTAINEHDSLMATTVAYSDDPISSRPQREVVLFRKMQ
jgi:hypothetical protein